MGRPPGHSPGVADIFRTHGSAWCRANAGHVSLGQLKVMSAIETCRTAALGGHVERCNDCAHVEIAYNSCRNRHCPKCQGAAARQWLEAQRDDLLPVADYHLVFTLPAPIAPIAFPEQDRRLRPAVQGRRRDADRHSGQPKTLGGSRWLHRRAAHLGLGSHSPPAPAQDCARRRPVVGRLALARLFRRLFLEGLAALHQAGRLAFFGDLVPLADRRPLTAALAPLRRTEWVVSAKRPFAGPAAVLAYLSGYTHRVAISNSRLIASDDHSVTFRWKDYRARGEAPGSTWIKAMTLPVDECIRHYGLFASPRRAANIAHLRKLLANADDASQPFGDAGMGVADAASADLADAFAIPQICPCCGGRMSVVETFARGALPRSFKADAARIDTS